MSNSVEQPVEHIRSTANAAHSVGYSVFYGCLLYDSGANKITTSAQVADKKKPHHKDRAILTFKFKAVSAAYLSNQPASCLEVKQDKCFSCYCMDLVFLLQAQSKQ